jgi:hypothetical protein
MNNISHPINHDQIRCEQIDIAQRFLNIHVTPIPLLYGQKQPAIPEWQKLTR